MQLKLKPSLLHSFGQINVEVLQTNIFRQPDGVKGGLNQFVRMFHTSSNSEFESEPKWNCGLTAHFDGEIFEIQADSEDPMGSISAKN